MADAPVPREPPPGPCAPMPITTRRSANRRPERVSFAGEALLLTVAGTFIIAELGDKTMLATFALAANQGALPTWIGSAADEIAANLVTVVVGRQVGHRLSPWLVGIGSAARFAIAGLAVPGPSLAEASVVTACSAPPGQAYDDSRGAEGGCFPDAPPGLAQHGSRGETTRLLHRCATRAGATGAAWPSGRAFWPGSRPGPPAGRSALRPGTAARARGLGAGRRACAGSRRRPSMAHPRRAGEPRRSDGAPVPCRPP